MSGSLDQVTNMMEANLRLTRTLAEVTQASSETNMRLGAVTSVKLV